VFTDHRANTILDVQPTLSRRQTRWVEFLSRFHMKWTFKKGAENPADPLSRDPSFKACATLGGKFSRSARLNAITRGKRVKTDGTIPEPYQVINDTSDDELVQVPERSPEQRKRWQTRIEEAYSKDPSFSSAASADGLKLEGALWYREGKVVMPDADNLRQELMLERHTPYSGHVGCDKTFKAISRYYWWKTTRQYVLHHVGTCHTCQLNKSRNEKPSGLPQPVEVPENSWECVSMDFVTGMPKSVSGLDAILVMVDKRTKMAHFAPCKTTCDAEQTAQLFVHNIVRLHGMPLKILKDRGPQFTSKFTEAVLRIMGTRQALSTACHPQT